MIPRFSVPFAFALSLAAACAPSPHDGDALAETSEHAAVSDIAKMTARGDGTFDVECRDGKKEIVSADDVTAGRVCKAAAFPASPFAAHACTGTPMTEAGALARLGGGTGPVRIGSYVLALRHRNAHFEWDARRGRWDLTHYTWDDAPSDALVAVRETGVSSSSGVRAVFNGRGSIEVAADAGGKPYLRLVSEAANVIGPDTTRFMRLVSGPMRPWASGANLAGPTFGLEEAQGAAAAWSKVTEYGWSIETRARSAGGYRRSWWFIGADITALVTERCGQYVSSQTLAGTASTSAAIGIYAALDD